MYYKLVRSEEEENLIFCNLWDLRFSRWWFKSRSSGLWHRAVIW